MAAGPFAVARPTCIAHCFTIEKQPDRYASLQCLNAMTVDAWEHGSLAPPSQSSVSILTIEAPWLLPTQNVGRGVVSSTNTRRRLVGFGSRYSIFSPETRFVRRIRSVFMPPLHSSPFLSLTTS